MKKRNFVYLYLQVVVFTVTIICFSSCKKKITEKKSGLPSNEEVMETANGWQVIGQSSIPNEKNVADVFLHFASEHGGQTDVVVETGVALSGLDQYNPFRWRLNTKGTNISFKSIPLKIWKGEGRTGDNLKCLWKPLDFYSKGMEDNELHLLNSIGIYSTDSLTTFNEPFSWKGDWLKEIIEYSGPIANVREKQFLITPANTFGGPLIAKVIGWPYYVYFDTDIRPLGAGVNAQNELVVLATNWRYPSSIFVYSSTKSVSNQTLSGVDKPCYNSIQKNAYNLADLTSGELVVGGRSYMWFDNSFVYIQVSDDVKSTLYKLNLSNYTVTVEKQNYSAPQKDSKVIVYKEKIGQLVEITDRNKARLWDGTQWHDIAKPVLQPTGTGAGTYMWDMCFENGIAYLLVEYKKTMVLLRKKIG